MKIIYYYQTKIKILRRKKTMIITKKWIHSKKRKIENGRRNVTEDRLLLHPNVKRIIVENNRDRDRDRDQGQDGGVAVIVVILFDMKIEEDINLGL